MIIFSIFKKIFYSFIVLIILIIIIIFICILIGFNQYTAVENPKHIFISNEIFLADQNGSRIEQEISVQDSDFYSINLIFISQNNNKYEIEKIRKATTAPGISFLFSVTIYDVSNFGQNVLLREEINEPILSDWDDNTVLLELKSFKLNPGYYKIIVESLRDHHEIKNMVIKLQTQTPQLVKNNSICKLLSDSISCSFPENIPILSYMIKKEPPYKWYFGKIGKSVNIINKKIKIPEKYSYRIYLIYKYNGNIEHFNRIKEISGTIDDDKDTGINIPLHVRISNTKNDYEYIIFDKIISNHMLYNYRSSEIVKLVTSIPLNKGEYNISIQEAQYIPELDGTESEIEFVSHFVGK